MVGPCDQAESEKPAARRRWQLLLLASLPCLFTPLHYSSWLHGCCVWEQMIRCLPACLVHCPPGRPLKPPLPCRPTPNRRLLLGGRGAAVPAGPLPFLSGLAALLHHPRCRLCTAGGGRDAHRCQRPAHATGPHKPVLPQGEAQACCGFSTPCLCNRSQIPSCAMVAKA